jgi:hypothetical protein
MNWLLLSSKLIRCRARCPGRYGDSSSKNDSIATNKARDRQPERMVPVRLHGDNRVRTNVSLIPWPEPGAGSAPELVRHLAAHRFRLRVVAQHCATTLPSRRAAGVQASGGFSLQPPNRCTIPTTGCSPCAADCTGRVTVGMTRNFADGEARAAAAAHACGTSGVLVVNMGRPSGPDVCTSSLLHLTGCDPYLYAPRLGRPVPAPRASGAGAIDGAEAGA